MYIYNKTDKQTRTQLTTKSPPKQNKTTHKLCTKRLIQQRATHQQQQQQRRQKQQTTTTTIKQTKRKNAHTFKTNKHNESVYTTTNIH